MPMNGIGIVKTQSGQVSGVLQNGVTLFKGIPYAAPPVGELRWKAPQPAAPWEGVRECTQFGDMCIQNPGWVGSDAFNNHPQSEDCLYLNIWTPAKKEGDDLPVLFWIHGGGYQGGVGDEELYHGWTLASKGIIVVSINYRLGALGYLAHPELRKESELGVSGNYGTLDQICALRWVKKNIRAFGGDPNRITIDGQSAGGMSVCTLLTSPLASGLYSGAIIQSGGPNKGRTTDLEHAEQDGVGLMKKLGCASVAEMRKLPPEKILENSVVEMGGGLTWAPIIDGVVLPENPYDAMVSGRMGQVPVIIGSNADEGLFAPFGGKTYEEFRANAGSFFGDRAEEFFRLYGVTEENFQRTSLDAQRDWGFLNVQNVLGKMKKALPCPVYQYYFTEPMVLTDGTVLGAMHSAELFYVFHTLHIMGGSTIDGESISVRREHPQYELSDRMGTYWTNFVKQGDPNSPGLPQWDVFCPKKATYMHFGAGQVGSESTRFPEKIAFLKQYMK